MQFEQAYSFLIEKLERELPQHYTYHSAEHTKQVVQAAKEIGETENISRHDLELLSAAALFHDAGFLEKYEDHEAISCQLAKTYLPKFDYSAEQIDKICGLIISTKMHSAPANKLENILRDADTAYIGTHRYFTIAENLYNELKSLGLIENRKAWHKKQIQFLEAHEFFTKTAINRFAIVKKQNLARLKSYKGYQQPQTQSHWMNIVKDAMLIITGVIIAGFGLKGFLVPNHFIDGGITGFSLLLHQIYHFNLSVTNFILNLPLIILSYYTVNRRFAIRAFICIVLLSVCLLYFPYPIITSDKLLISIFGGFFLGIGGGLIMRVGSALDGVEVLALLTLRHTSFTIAEIILAFNVIIFGIAAFQFGIEIALYSILTYFAATKTLDYVVEGFEAYTGVTIISSQSEQIKYKLVNELGRGITIYKGERGYLPENFEISAECDIIFTVITRLELRRLKNLVYETDPKAFVFANTIKEASGGIIKRRQHIDH